MPLLEHKSSRELVEPDDCGPAFFFSQSLFWIGLALVTFEQVRPFGIEADDYCFCLSLLLLVFCPKLLVFRSMKSGVLLAASLILCGSVLSLLNVFNVGDALRPLARPFLLFALFAPLAVCHSRTLRKNILFLLGGISVNCAITLLQAWVFPGIVNALSINPQMSDYISDLGRFQGLTGHPNTLGLSAGLAILISIGLIPFEMSWRVRSALMVAVLVCALAALLSGSRTFLASLVPGLITLALVNKVRVRTVLVSLVAVSVIGIGLSYLAPSLMSEYIARIELSGLDYSADYGRLIAADLAVEQILEKPILGWGIDQLGHAGEIEVPVTGELSETHVTFLQYWYGAGLLGAVGFLALFALPARQMLRALKMNASSNSTGPLRLVLACYVLLFIVSNLHPLIYNRFLYMPVFIFAGYAACLRGQLEGCLRAHSRLAGQLAPSI